MFFFVDLIIGSAFSSMLALIFIYEKYKEYSFRLHQGPLLITEAPEPVDDDADRPECIDVF